MGSSNDDRDFVSYKGWNSNCLDIDKLFSSEKNIRVR